MASDECFSVLVLCFPALLIDGLETMAAPHSCSSDYRHTAAVRPRAGRKSLRVPFLLWAAAAVLLTNATLAVLKPSAPLASVRLRWWRAGMALEAQLSHPPPLKAWEEL